MMQFSQQQKLFGLLVLCVFLLQGISLLYIEYRLDSIEQNLSSRSSLYSSNETYPTRQDPLGQRVQQTPPSQKLEQLLEEQMREVFPQRLNTSRETTQQTMQRQNTVYINGIRYSYTFTIQNQNSLLGLIETTEAKELETMKQRLANIGVEIHSSTETTIEFQTDDPDRVKQVLSLFYVDW